MCRACGMRASAWSVFLFPPPPLSPTDAFSYRHGWGFMYYDVSDVRGFMGEAGRGAMLAMDAVPSTVWLPYLNQCSFSLLFLLIAVAAGGSLAGRTCCCRRRCSSSSPTLPSTSFTAASTTHVSTSTAEGRVVYFFLFFSFPLFKILCVVA